MSLSLLDGSLIKNASIAIAKVIGLQTALDGKANSSHGHAISDVSGLQTALDSKVGQSYVDTGLSAKANLNSPDFTGNPTAPTQTTGNNSTRLATTAFVQGALTALGTLYKVGGTDVALADGGTGASLTSPGADRMMFWDQSGGGVTWLAPGTNMAINGTQLDCTYVAPTPESVVLLGTLTTTSGASQQLAGLDLTGYKFLLICYQNISFNTNSALMIGNTTSDDESITSSTTSSASYIGQTLLDLSDGRCVTQIGANGAAPTSLVRDTPISDASTTITFAPSGVSVFDGGSIRVYGVR